MEKQKEDDAHYMVMALQVAKAALSVGEVPVGCVLVLKDHLSIPGGYESVVISHGANQVNATRDATRHAEIVAIDRILTLGTSSDQMRLALDTGMEQYAESSGFQHRQARQKHWEDRWVNVAGNPNHWKNQFGWKNKTYVELRSPEVLQNCELYVTCEPCIMCSSALATVGIKRVIFGCKNDRFGGCGSLLHLHRKEESLCESSANQSLDYSKQSSSKVSQGYTITSGILENEAIALLRSFYDRENIYAPDSKRKRKLGDNEDLIL
ncbi:unnamed protein product [Cylindrotheca closterium]|uniref:CMP/dCMP-type deaminase domain-containing protein n=1 Tax=Cylindrotheca closterium TaxID=2856 RepID=A0AAD2FN29_9STRA|nr:unnamed protein product [Cylindrotheca closterium]